MYINHNTIFGKKDADTAYRASNTNFSKPEDFNSGFAQNTIENNAYKEFGKSIFDNEINENKFQTKSYSSQEIFATVSSSGTVDDKSDTKFGALLDFVDNNSDAISKKINSNEDCTPKEESDEAIPVKPSFPKDFNLSELEKLFGKTTPETPEPEDQVEEPSGKFDINSKIEESSQGLIGDCWLLAGLNSLSLTENGKQIIKDSITNNGDGTYTVHFKGISETCSCEIPDESLESADESGLYASGDKDVLLVELATETLLTALQNGEVNLPDNAPKLLYNEKGNPLDGGYPSDIVYLLTGKNMEYKNILDENSKCLKGDELENFYNNELESFYTRFEQNPDSSCGCLHIKLEDEDIIVKDIYGNNTKLTKAGDNHSVSVKSVDENTVTLINPWDSSTEVTIEKDTLKNHILAYEYMEV